MNNDVYLPRYVGNELLKMALSAHMDWQKYSQVEPMFFILRDLLTLVPEYVDPTVAAMHELRRFDFLRDLVLYSCDWNHDDEIVCAGLRALQLRNTNTMRRITIFKSSELNLRPFSKRTVFIWCCFSLNCCQLYLQLCGLPC